MEDFNALASSLAAGVVDVRGCLILSRDGLVLGAYPSQAETQTKPAWLRFATMGDPERGFAQFGTETWCYVRRGPYAAFAVTGPAARPGLVIDHIEQALLAAEETRGKLEGVRGESVATPIVPTARPRTPLHAERPLEEPLVIRTDAPLGTSAGVGGAMAPAPADPTGSGDRDPELAHEAVGSDPLAVPCGPTGSAEEGPEATSDLIEAAAAAGELDPTVPGPPFVAGEPAEPEGSAPGDPAGSEEPPGVRSGGVWATDEEVDEVDRFSLTREFGQLLQDDGPGADGYATRDRRT